MQGDAAWLAARAGHITASRMKDILANGRGKGTPGQMVETYALELATERLIGGSVEGSGFANADWGHEMEPHARAAYEVRTGTLIEEVDFIRHPSMEWVGASPDGFVGSDGGIEAKCPVNPRIHMDTLINGMPAEHAPQVQGNLLVTGRKWWDFISYNPTFPEPYRLYIQRVLPDPAMQAKIGERIGFVLARVEEILGQLEKAA